MRLLAVTGCVALTLVLTGCGDGGDTSSPAGSGSAARIGQAKPCRGPVNWTPMSSGVGISVLTYATGRQRVKVDVSTGGSLSESATVGPASTPYSIEVDAVVPKFVKRVTLTSAEGSSCIVHRG